MERQCRRQRWSTNIYVIILYISFYIFIIFFLFASRLFITIFLVGGPTAVRYTRGRGKTTVRVKDIILWIFLYYCAMALYDFYIIMYTYNNIRPVQRNSFYR